MASWNSLSVTEQERVIGRTKLEDIEFDDDEKPANAHIALNVITDEDGPNARSSGTTCRSAGRKGEFGTYFIGYSRTPEVTEQMLQQHVPRRSARQHRPDPGLLHRVTGGLFFSPSVDFLDNPPPLPDFAAAAPAIAEPHPRTARWQSAA